MRLIDRDELPINFYTDLKGETHKVVDWEDIENAHIIHEIDDSKIHEQLTKNGCRKPIYMPGIDDIGKSRNNTTTYARVESATI